MGEGEGTMTQTTDDWKETVRDIYDMMHKSEFGISDKNNSAASTADKVIGLIEKRHYSYFCEQRKP